MRANPIRIAALLCAIGLPPLSGCEGERGIPASESPPAFQRLFGGLGVEVGNAVRELPDGGFIVAGYTSSHGAGEEDVYLLRTDAAGIGVD